MKKLFKWLSVNDRYSKMYMDKHFAGLGINSSQHFYIIHLCENPGITQDKLLGLVRVNPSNVTRALAQLEKAGYVTRVSNPRDKRTFHLYPTESARTAYPRILKIQAEWRQVLTRGISEEQQALLLDLLERTARNAMDYFDACRDGAVEAHGAETMTNGDGQ